MLCDAQARSELDAAWLAKTTCDKDALQSMHAQLTSLKSTLDHEVTSFEQERRVSDIHCMSS